MAMRWDAYTHCMRRYNLTLAKGVGVGMSVDVQLVAAPPSSTPDVLHFTTTTTNALITARYVLCAPPTHAGSRQEARKWHWLARMSSTL